MRNKLLQEFEEHASGPSGLRAQHKFLSLLTNNYTS